MPHPIHLDLDRERALTISWSDGTESVLPIAHLRRNSPSADQKKLRSELASNPLTVMPASTSTEPISAVDAELIGNYALRIRFSDGHETGIYSWEYLREIDPARGTSQ